jgi:hypothetical protein
MGSSSAERHIFGSLCGLWAHFTATFVVIVPVRSFHLGFCAECILSLRKRTNDVMTI